MTRTRRGPAHARTGPAPHEEVAAAAKPQGPFTHQGNGSPCHRTARAYAGHGWALLPVARVVEGRCSCGWPPERCTSPGKHPLAPGGRRGASTDPATIDQWWGRWPTANVGIATGAVSGIAVLDVDGEPGRRSLVTLEATYGVLPGTLTVVTSRGCHLYYGHAPGLGIGAGRYGAGLDHRGAGGYVVVPPSVHPSGHVYTWLNAADDPAPWAHPLPSWPAAQLPVEPPRDPAPLPRTPAACTRPDGRTGSLRGLVQTVLNAQPGTRNCTLNWAAYAAGRHIADGRFDRTSAVSALLIAAQYAGLTEREAAGTIASGLRAGAQS